MRANELPPNLSGHAAREALSTLSRPCRTLPASWWDEDATVNMAAWARKHHRQRLVTRFNRRRRSK